MLDPPAAAFLAAAAHAGLSIIFAGPPGAAKRTLLSCCGAALDPTRRVVAEVVFDAGIPLANVS